MRQQLSRLPLFLLPIYLSYAMHLCLMPPPPHPLVLLILPFTSSLSSSSSSNLLLLFLRFFSLPPPLPSSYSFSYFILLFLLLLFLVPPHPPPLPPPPNPLVLLILPSTSTSSLFSSSSSSPSSYESSPIQLLTVPTNTTYQQFTSILNLDYRRLFSLLRATRLARFLHAKWAIRILPHLIQHSSAHSFTSVFRPSSIELVFVVIFLLTFTLQ